MAARFTVGKTGKQAKCPSEEKWVKQGHIYTTGCYSAIKKNKIILFSATLVDLEIVMLREVKSDIERQVSYDIAYMQSLKKKGCCWVAKSLLTLCAPMDCSPPGSSVHGISQARILEWVVTSFSRGSSQPRDRTRISCIGRWILYC